MAYGWKTSLGMEHEAEEARPLGRERARVDHVVKRVIENVLNGEEVRRGGGAGARAGLKEADEVDEARSHTEERMRILLSTSGQHGEGRLMAMAQTDGSGARPCRWPRAYPCPAATRPRSGRWSFLAPHMRTA
jgi:hypothetical protein